MEEDITTQTTWSKRTNEIIDRLHPQMRAIAIKFINKVQEKLFKKLIITDGYRTFEEQNALYAKGRTKPGRIVTKAKGGQSYHNYGLAFDCYITKNDKVDFTISINNEIAKIGEELGLEWGGSWKTIVDKPHFQLTKGNITQLLALVKSKKVDDKGYVLI